MKIAVVPVESPGMSARVSPVIPSPGGLVRLADASGERLLSPDAHGVLYEGGVVFVRLPAAGEGGKGRAAKFEETLAGPRPVWIPSVDLAEIIARLLRGAGKDSAAFRDPVRLPGVSAGSPERLPPDWRTFLAGWYGKDPEPVDLREYADRGAEAVLLAAAGDVLVGQESVSVSLRLKMVDPRSGRVLARGAGAASMPERRFPRGFPAAFRSLAERASKHALEEMGLVL